MKVKYNNGAEAHVRPELGRELVRAGLAVEVPPQGNLIEQSRKEQQEQIQKGPKLDWSPRWSVELIGIVKPWLAIVLRVGNQTLQYFGHPKNVNRCVKWPGGCRWLSGLGRECPAEIEKEYKKLWNDDHTKRHPASAADAVGSEENQTMAETKARYDRAVEHGDASPGIGH